MEINEIATKDKLSLIKKFVSKQFYVPIETETEINKIYNLLILNQFEDAVTETEYTYFGIYYWKNIPKRDLLKAIEYCLKGNAHLIISQIYFQKKDYVNAEKYCLIASEKHINVKRINIALGHLLNIYRMSENNQKLQEYELLAVEHKQFLLLGRFYRHLNHLLKNNKTSLDAAHDKETFVTKAKSYLLLAIDEGEYEAYINLAFIYSEKSDFMKAEEYLLLALDRGIKKSLICLGIIYERQKNYVAAEEYYLRALEAGLNGARNQLGILYESKGDYEKAIEYYTSNYRLANLYKKIKDYNNAIKHYLSEIYDLRCRTELLCLLRNMNEDLSLELFVNVEDGEILEEVGKLCHKNGDYENAIKYYIKGSHEENGMCHIRLIHLISDTVFYTKQNTLLKLFDDVTDIRILNKMGSFFENHRNWLNAVKYYRRGNNVKCLIRCINQLLNNQDEIPNDLFQFILTHDFGDNVSNNIKIIQSLYKTKIDTIELHFKYQPGADGMAEAKQDFLNQLNK